MAVATSSSSSEHVLQQMPLHQQNVNVSPESIVKADRDLCRECIPAKCNACPHCHDRCRNENCRTCSTKCFVSARAVNNNPFQTDETYYTMCEIARHDHADSCWLVVGDTIYDATSYIAKHPGGKTSIVKKSGGKVDCSVDFDFHSKNARKIWKKYKVGKVRPCPSQQASSSFGTDEQCIIS